MADLEEIYDEAEVEENTRPAVALPESASSNGNSRPVSTSSNRNSGSPPEVVAVGLTLKQRLAQLREIAGSENEPVPSKPKPLQSKNLGINLGQRPPVSNKPGFPPRPGPKPTSGPTETGNLHVVKLSQLTRGRQTLKTVDNKRDSQLTDSDPRGAVSPSLTEKVNGQSDDMFLNKDGVKFKKRPFIKKFGKPPKTPSLTEFSAPLIKYLDTESGVERRMGASGRAGLLDSAGSMIRSMTEEEELEEQSSASSATLPALPIREPTLPAPPALPPTNPSRSNMSKALPALPSRHKPLPVPAEPSVEELYDEGEAAASEDDQELYDDIGDAPLPSQAGGSIQPPEQPSLKNVSPDPSKKQTKAEKEQEKREKKEREKLDKQRQKEAKEQEVFIKKYKITDDEFTSCDSVRCVRLFTGGGKGTISVNLHESVFLVRKLSDDKWIVKKPNTQLVGLVDASCMVDPSEVQPKSTNGPAVESTAGEDEEIYEELE